MLNEKETNSELCRIKNAMSFHTREALNKILSAVDDMSQNELTAYTREKLSKIDSLCCLLLRNQSLLSALFDYNTADKDGSRSECYCSFPEAYDNCCRTVNTICAQADASFDYFAFTPPCILPISAKECGMIILLPIALAYSHNRATGVRLEATRRGDYIELNYRYYKHIPPIPELIKEALKTDYSNGLYFGDSLIAYTLARAIESCGGDFEFNDNLLCIRLPIASSEYRVNSRVEPYIDNRFSLPYIMLSEIINRRL